MQTKSELCLKFRSNFLLSPKKFKTQDRRFRRASHTKFPEKNRFKITIIFRPRPRIACSEKVLPKYLASESDCLQIAPATRSDLKTSKAVTKTRLRSCRSNRTRWHDQGPTFLLQGVPVIRVLAVLFHLILDVVEAGHNVHKVLWVEHHKPLALLHRWTNQEL